MSIFVNKNGQQLGPFTEAELKAKVASGEFSPQDNIWWEGQTQWIPLAQTPYAPGGPVGMSHPPGAGPTSQLAVWALVSGCVSMLCWLFVSIPAVILGHMALRDLKKNPAQEGHGLAVAGLVLGYISLALGLIYFSIFAIGLVMGLMGVNSSH